jgi:predicted RecA/RadA family phage recombinase
MKKKTFKKLSIAGLVFLGVVFVFAITMAFLAEPRAASAAMGLSGLMGFGLFGMATAVPIDVSPNIRTTKYTHNAATAAGDVLVVNSCVLVAVNAALANVENVYVYAGKVTIPKAAPLVINTLDQVYWVTADGNVNKTASGNTPCGFCVENALSADTTVTILLQPTSTFSVTSLDETLVRYATVNLTNAQIKALRATPKELVAAPGANKFVEFVSAELFLDYGANVLTESADNLAVKFENGTGVAVSQAIEATGFIDAAADTLTNALPKIDAIVASASALNKALVLHNTGDGEYAGNAGADTTMKVKIAYRVHDVTV